MALRAAIAIVLLSLIGGCSLGPGAPAKEPDVQGNADVVGQVIQSSGLPLSNSTVEVECAAVALKANVPTDSTGHYGVNLTSPSQGSIRCVFGVPDLVTNRIRVDTVIGFSPIGQLHPLQFLNLQEPGR